MDNGFIPENWVAPEYTEEDAKKDFSDLLDSNLDLRVDVLMLFDLIEPSKLINKQFRNKFTIQKAKEIMKSNT